MFEYLYSFAAICTLYIGSKCLYFYINANEDKISHLQTIKYLYMTIENQEETIASLKRTLTKYEEMMEISNLSNPRITA